MLTLKLRRMAADAVRGTYTIKGVPNRMPDRALFMHPEAAAAFDKVAPWIVVSDMFRSPESSLNAVATGRGAQPPGYSAHNYGGAVDAALRESMARLGVKTKRELDEAMEAVGFYCHRRDHEMGHESWHFNYLGVGAKVSGSITSDEVERRILEMYGHALAPDNMECQRLLAKLGLYHGDSDGDIGPLSRQAVRAFERAWGLNVDSVLDSRTRRTLAYVACERDLVA